ncbi:hypothetical protein [Alistipes finegoldii]
METTFEIIPAYQSPAQKEQSERNRRRFMRRRAILRWVMRTFRLYR